jgi:hypothetical protein
VVTIPLNEIGGTGLAARREVIPYRTVSERRKETSDVKAAISGVTTAPVIVAVSAIEVIAVVLGIVAGVVIVAASVIVAIVVV